MIKKVEVEHFKRFQREEFILEDAVVLAGPNNSGKTTLLQALVTWSTTLERWRLGKGQATPGREKGQRGAPTPRAGQPVTRKDFVALPLREFSLLWNQTKTGLTRGERKPGQKPGEPRLIQLTVHGTHGLTEGSPWRLTMELRYQSAEQIYVKPVGIENGRIPDQAGQLLVVHCPPFSGIGPEEKRMDRGAQQLEIGRGKPGDVLRNLLLEVSEAEDQWESLVEAIQELFRVTLIKPVYDPSLPFILCEYKPGVFASPAGVRYDVASGGSGFHQVLLLLSFFHARPASVLLLDEPDAHLHVILQRQIHNRLRDVAIRRSCQLIIATHSEVLLDATTPSKIVSFLGRPHRLVVDAERDRVREAMARLTTLDLLLAEQGRAVLYCEGQSDFAILEAWADALDHPAKRFFASPFFHSNEGRNPREARDHLFAIKAVVPDLRGLLILDGDNRATPDHEVGGVGLSIARWRRYEIENYLLVPAAIERLLIPDPPDLFSGGEARAAIEYLKTQFPPPFFDDPLSDEYEIAVEVAASKRILPQMFAAAGRIMEKSDFFHVARVMKPEEIHPEVKVMLDLVASLAPAERD